MDKSMIEVLANYGLPSILVVIFVMFLKDIMKKNMDNNTKLQNDLKESYTENRKVTEKAIDCVNKNTEMVNKMQDKFHEDRTVTKELVKKVDEIQDDVRDIKNKIGGK